MLIPSIRDLYCWFTASLSRRVNANSQLVIIVLLLQYKLIKKGEC